MQPGWRNCSPSCIPHRLASDMQPLARNDSAAEIYLQPRGRRAKRQLKLILTLGLGSTLKSCTAWYVMHLCKWRPMQCGADVCSPLHQSKFAHINTLALPFLLANHAAFVLVAYIIQHRIHQSVWVAAVWWWICSDGKHPGYGCIWGNDKVTLSNPWCTKWNHMNGNYFRAVKQIHHT